MTRDEVLRIGRQAGAFIEAAQEKDLLWLERFAALVMEEDAKVCEKQITGHHFLATHGHFDHMDQSATNCAAAIRARKPA